MDEKLKVTIDLEISKVNFEILEKYAENVEKTDVLTMLGKRCSDYIEAVIKDAIADALIKKLGIEGDGAEIIRKVMEEVIH